MWFLEELDPGTPTFHLPFGLRFRGPLHTEALRAALAEVVARHESLRTGFHLQGNDLLQRIHHEVVIPWSEFDLSEIPTPERDTRLASLTADLTRPPFDLRTAPLLRAALIRLANHDHAVWVTTHHLVTDGWSVQIMLREWAEAYAAQVGNRAWSPPELAIQYADFATWQRDCLATGSQAPALAAWIQRLQGAPPHLDLPTDFPHPDPSAARSGRVTRTLPPSLTSQLKDLAAREHATPFMVHLAALSLLLKRWVGESEVVVGTPISLRDREELEGVVGLFLNTLPLRCAGPVEGSFLDLLRQARDVALDAFAGRDVPFEKLVEALHPERSTRYTPVFQALLNLVPPTPVVPLAWTGLQVTDLEPVDVPSKYDFTLYVHERGPDTELELVYRADLFAAARMTEFLAQLVGILTYAAASPSAPLRDLSLVTPDAARFLPDPQQQLVRSALASLTEPFERVAARSPACPAIVQGSQTWSYGDVERHSAATAHALRAAQVKPGSLVALHATRTAPLIPALIGVLRAGAALLLLDDAYPPEILAHRLRLARPAAWIQITPAAPPRVLLEEMHRLGTLQIGLAAQHPEDPTSAPEALAFDGPPLPERPAYVLFTSGSTGEPKAVVTPVHAVAHFLEWYLRTFQPEPGLRFSQFSGLGHDPFFREVLGALSSGGTLCLP
ncbi:MAG: AMP-binding protein, partial [Verrucomicrobiales bacterium]|nr:AMP-binding protein [Verrucomicrobiales bacterium]